MLPAPAAGPALRVLDEMAAARTWNWILSRQGLADSRRLSSAWQVADTALGLHASRLPSPYAIVAARTADSAVPASLFTGPVRASLLTVRCMRKTLHTLPLPLAAAAHIATLRFRDRDARRAVLNAGCTMAAVDRLADQLCALLRDGPLPHREIETLWPTRSGGTRAGRLAIKVAWERGTIAYINAATSLESRGQDLRPDSVAYPALDLSLHPRPGRHRTGHRLLRPLRAGDPPRRHLVVGPVSDRHHHRAAGTGRPLVAVATPWSEDPCLMFADQAERERRQRRSPPGVQFLAHEDTALKAYSQTRSRYLGGLPQRRAFNQIGEASHRHHRRHRGGHLVMGYPHRQHPAPT